jgi:DNA-binding MarR family transcriptional regulator
MSSSEEKIKIGEIGKYLGVGGRVAERLIKSGVIPYERDPLDQRCKLVKVSDLDKLKRESLRKGRRKR